MNYNKIECMENEAVVDWKLPPFDGTKEKYQDREKVKRTCFVNTQR